MEKEYPFDDARAGTYQSRGGQKRYAFWKPDGAIYFKDIHWKPGERQAMEGPHYTVIIPDAKVPGQFDIYGVAKDRFEAEHVPLAEPNTYQQKKRVRAYQLTEPLTGSTVVDGKTEATREIPVGHWLVQQPKGEVQGISPEQFQMIYEPA